MKSWFFLFVFSFSRVANADVIFLDMNNAPAEIAAARRSLRAGEKLYVIPDENDPRRNKIAELKKRQDQLREQIRTANDPRQRRDLKGEFARTRNELQKTKLRGRALSAEFSNVIARGGKPGRLAISGHDGQGAFYGELGSIVSSDVTGAFSENPGSCDGLSSMFLMGCWTTTPGSLKNDWKKVCPATKVFGGFWDSAPSRTNAAGPTILSGFMVRDERAQKVQTAAELTKIFNEIPGIKHTSAALCANDFLARVGKPTQSLKDIEAGCNSVLDSKLGQRYMCYFNGEKGCENPPKNTRNGEVRQYYRLLQDNAHCNDLLSRAVPDRDTVLRLIFFDNVKAKFNENHSNELAKLNEALDKIVAPEDLKLENLEKMSRTELIRRLQGLTTYLDEITGKPGENIEGLRAFVRDAKRTLLDLAPACVPFSWVENHSDSSPCMGDSYFDGRPINRPPMDEIEMPNRSFPDPTGPDSESDTP